MPTSVVTTPLTLGYDLTIGIYALTGGTISVSGSDTSIREKGVVWSTNPFPRLSNSSFYTGDGSGPSSYESVLVNLLYSTTYYVRAYVKKCSGCIIYGNILQFNIAPILATVTTDAITGTGGSTNTGGGDVTDSGNSPVTARGIVWSTNPNPSITSYTGITSDGSGLGSFVSTLTGLVGGTTYYVAAYATNIAGTAYGSIISFNQIATITVTTDTIYTAYGPDNNGGGIVSSINPLIAEGLVWATFPNPTLANNQGFSNVGTTIGHFTSNLTGLEYGSVTLYYAAAYATDNTDTTVYGNYVTFYQFPYCLAAGSRISLKDGTFKNIEDITFDDELLVWNFDDGVFDSAKPLWIMEACKTSQYNLLKFSDGSELKTIIQHRIFNVEKGQFTYPMTDDTPIGTTTFNSNGEFIHLVSKEVVDEPVDYYNIITTYHINLFANSILTSCRYNNIYPIENMKYVKDGATAANTTRTDFENIISEKYIDGLRLTEQPFTKEEMSPM